MKQESLQSKKVAKIDLLLDVIANSPQNHLFPHASDVDIVDLEKKLGKKLPNSFKKFLKVTDGATLYQTEEVLGIKDDEEDMKEGIFTIKEDLSEYPDNLIPFYYSNEMNFFDANEMHDGEYKIVRWNKRQNKPEVIANSFTDWLHNIVRDNE